MSDPMDIDAEPDTKPPPPQILGDPFVLSPPRPLVPELPHPDSPQDESGGLNKSLNNRSDSLRWSLWIQEDDPKKRLYVFAELLGHITEVLGATENFIPRPSFEDALKLIEGMDDNQLRDWQDGVEEGIAKRSWVKLAFHPILQKPEPCEYSLPDQRWGSEELLTAAYSTPFVGNTAEDFVEYLAFTEAEITAHKIVPIAKAFPVVQSSGTGKSRMLTEAGKHIFTLPICIRKERTLGYPPPDLVVVQYFRSFNKENDLSHSAHIALACFIAAAHKMMHESLREAQNNNVDNLRVYWHECMEPAGERSYRDLFFSKVIQRATALQENHENLQTGPSPKRSKVPEDEPESKNINKFAATIYTKIALEATKDLMDFLTCIESNAQCVTYFDEAHELGLSFWVLLRLLRSQEPQTRMWYIFMGTKSRLSYYAPRPSELLSLRLKRELASMLPPYVALGFDQHVIANTGTRTVKMGELQSIKHLSQYGRPLWNALLSECSDHDIIEMAGLKLTNGVPFSATNKDHVFAVLSQRLCLDAVLSGSEAIELADNSVAHHMRLLTGFSSNGALFYTHSPSEPILVLGSGHMLYQAGHPADLPQSIDTLSRQLCSAGLVEKGIMGELAARTLLLVARDFTVPMSGHRNLLKPVRLLEFLATLFGENWAGSEQSKFNSAFATTYVNFTHWIVTKDPLPAEPDPQLLANLWARGAALQCCFNQKAIDLEIVTYDGSVDAAAAFNPSLLSGFIIQVKFKNSGDAQAETQIRPFGIPRDPHHPLPYLALLMELGNESNYQGCSKIKPTPSKSIADGEFPKLTAALASAKEKYALRLQQVGGGKKAAEPQKQALNAAQLAVDSYNRYSISVRGASPEVYRILQTARIAEQFANLLKITAPSPGNQEATLQHMRPLERLGDSSNHTAWMSEYAVPEETVELK